VRTGLRLHSFDTNVAESAHAQSQQDGVNLSLLAAIQTAFKIETHFLETEMAICSSGIASTYGNNTTTGRAKNAAGCQKSEVQKKELALKKQLEGPLKLARELADYGVDDGVLEGFFVAATKKLKRG